MMDQEVHYGGALSGDITGDYTILRGKRVITLDPDANGYAAILPDATTLDKGGPHFFIINESATYNLLVKDDGGNLLDTMTTKEMAICALVDNSTSNGLWIVHLKPLRGEESA